MHPLWNATLGWLAALTMVLLCCGCGRAVARLLGVGGIGWGLSFGVGSWIVSVLLMALGVTTGLQGSVLPVVLCALAIPAALGLWHGHRDRQKVNILGLLCLPPWVTIGLLLLWISPYLVQTLVPDTDWDSAIYHRPMAWGFLRDGITAVNPYACQLNFPGAIPLFYAAYLALGLESAIVPFNLLAVLVLVLSVLEVGDRFLGRRAALWAVGLCLSTNLILELGLDARNDVFLAIYFLLGLHCFLAYRQEPQRAAWLALLGMVLGMAVGTKLTGLLAVGLFGSGTLYLLAAHRQYRVLPLLLLGILCLVVPAGFWFVRNAVQLGDPIYPFLRGPVYELPGGEMRPFYPDLDALMARSDKPPASFMAADQGPPTEAHNIFNLFDLFFNSRSYSNKSHHWLQPLLFLGFLLPSFDRRRISWWLFGYAFLGYLAIGIKAPLARYATPMLPVMALCAGVVIDTLRSRSWFLVFLAITLGWAGHNMVREWIKVVNMRPLSYLSGEVTYYHWMVRQGHNESTATSMVADTVNIYLQRGEIPRHACILMVGEGKCELFFCNTIPDISYEAFPWQVEYVRAEGDLDRLHASLKMRGINYILYNRGYLSWIATHLRMDSEQLLNRDYMYFGLFQLEHFLDGHAQLVFEDKGISFYRLE